MTTVGEWQITSKGWMSDEWHHLPCGTRVRTERSKETGMTRECHIHELRRHLDRCGKARIETNIAALVAERAGEGQPQCH